MGHWLGILQRRRVSDTETTWQAFRVQRSSNPSEYFLIENRYWGNSYDAPPTANYGIPDLVGTGLPGQGLAIWHIDETRLPAFQKGDFSAPGFLARVNGPAAGLWNSNFNALSTPNSNWNDGTPSDICISAISGPGPTVTFHLDFTGVPRDLYVYANDPNHTLLAQSTTTSDHEHVALSVQADQTYYVKVIGYNGAMNPHYDMVITGPQVAGDRFEPNDDTRRGV